MNTEELLKFHLNTCDRAREIMRKKNHDYAGADGSTPFANFEASSKLGVASVTSAMLVRIIDKIQRINTFDKAGTLLTEGESAEDSCDDAINYFILLKAYLTQEREKEGPRPPPVKVIHTKAVTMVGDSFMKPDKADK